MLAGTKKFVLIALFTGILIILVNLAWWFYYQRTEELLEKQLGRRLSAVAASGAVMVDPIELGLLLAGDFATYADFTDLLVDLQMTDSLAEVFILDENYKYLVTTSVEVDSAYFLVSLNGRYIDSLLFGQSNRPVVTPTYRTGDLFLKSAFVPLLDYDEMVVAVLGVEANVDYFVVLSELRQNLWYATGLSFIGGAFLGLVFLLLQRRISSAEQQLFLQQTHAYLGRMVAVVSHELKNPLTIIRAAAERLANKTEAQEAEYVTEEVDRLNQIVSGYLEFARADGKLLSRDSQETFDLSQLVERIKRHLHDKYMSEHITWLSTPGSGETISMTGYPRSLRQVLLNLLINGVEACLSVGTEIAVGIGVEDLGEEIRLSIRDHGPGFSKAEAKKAFAPFHTSKHKGSGLGLFLSKKIISEMGGSIRISLESREGSEIIIELPKQPKG